MNPQTHDNHDPLDRRLDAAFKALPREKARPGFRDEVLRRAQAAGSPSEAVNAAGGKVVPFRGRSLRQQAPLWLSVAAALIALALGAREWQHRHEQQESMRRIAELRAQYDQLADTVRQLRDESAAARPVVYLGGSEQVDLVLDLQHLAEGPPDPNAAKVDPEDQKAMAAELAKLLQDSSTRAVY